MTDRELNITLREMARKNGLCDAWYDEWKDDDTIDMCLDRYIRGFDFVRANDYPPLEFIREHFRLEDLHRNHIYLDEDVDVEAENGFYVFLGNCKGKFTAKGFVAVTVYLRHDSNIEVSSKDGAIVFVNAYDHSKVKREKDEYSSLRYHDRRDRKRINVKKEYHAS